MRRIAPLLPLPLLSGCLFPGVDGVWMFEIAYPTEQTECSVAVDENFTDASYVEAGAPDSEWTVTSVVDGSPNVVFGEIVPTAHGEAVLLLADAVYQGMSEDGVWTFVLEDRSVSTQSETHDAGYTFVEEDEEVTTVTIRFERDGEDASGKIDARSEVNESTSETDRWDPVDVGIASGQLRANILDPDTGGGAVRNQPDSADCQGTTCELTVVTTCASSSRFTAVRTNHDPSEYEYLADVGQ